MRDSIRLLKPLFRGFPLVILAMVLASLVAKKYLSYTTPFYESTVKLKLADLNEGVPGSNLFKDFDVFTSSNKIAGEIELMKSSLLIEKAIDTLGFNIEISRIGDIKTKELYHESPIKVIPLWNYKAQGTTLNLTLDSNGGYTLTTPKSSNDIHASLGDTISIPSGRLIVKLNHQFIKSREHITLEDDYEVKVLSNSQLTKLIHENLDINSSNKDVPVVSITYKSAVPKKAAVFVNALASAYIEDYIESKYSAANTTVKFLADRIDKVAVELSESESAIQVYKDRKGIINLRQETETDLRKVAQMKIQQTNLKMSLDAVTDLEIYLKNNDDRLTDLAPNFQAFNDLLSTELIKKIKLLQAEKKDLLLTYTEQNSKVKVVDEKLLDLTSYLLESVKNSRRNLSRKYEDLSLDIQEAELSFIGLPSKEKNLNILNRDFNIYQNSYNFLNEKRIEAEIAQAAKVAFHRIITPAVPSSDPVSPNRAIILIVSVLLACFGSIAFIYIVHNFKGKVNDPYGVETNSDTPIVSKTPFLKTMTAAKLHFLKESLQLDLKGFRNQNSVVVYSSKTNNEGRHFHINQMKHALIKQGKSVKIIHIGDCDSGDSCDLFLDAQNLLAMSKQQIQDVFNKQSEKHDIVLVNNEPLENKLCGILIMRFADVNHYVLDTRRTPIDHLQEVDSTRVEFNLPNFNFILNRYGYNPNVITVAIAQLKRMLSSISPNTAKKNNAV